MKKISITQIKKIKLIILDCDGILTDGGIIVGTDSLDLMKFNVQDGAGIAYARKFGYRFAVITGRNTKMVAMRAAMLHIDEVHQGIFYKIHTVKDLLKKYHLKPEEMAYMGDDLLDLPPMGLAGLVATVPNAVPEVKKFAHYVTKRRGGD